MKDEREFATHVEEAITSLYRALASACDDYDFAVEMNSGALTIEFDRRPAKFVVSPNVPLGQIWVSALSKSFKLDWDAVENSFVLPSSGQTLKELIEEAVAKQLGEDFSL